MNRSSNSGPPETPIDINNTCTYHKVNLGHWPDLNLDLTPDLGQKVKGHCCGVRQVNSDLPPPTAWKLGGRPTAVKVFLGEQKDYQRGYFASSSSNKVTNLYIYTEGEKSQALPSKFGAFRYDMTIITGSYYIHSSVLRKSRRGGTRARRAPLHPTMAPYGRHWRDFSDRLFAVGGRLGCPPGVHFPCKYIRDCRASNNRKGRQGGHGPVPPAYAPVHTHLCSSFFLRAHRVKWPQAISLVPIEQLSYT